MNANRIIDMVIRQITRRLVKHGVDKGIDLASRVGRKPDQPADASHDPDVDRHMRDGAARQKQNANQMRQMTRQMRRFIKF